MLTAFEQSNDTLESACAAKRAHESRPEKINFPPNDIAAVIELLNDRARPEDAPLLAIEIEQMSVSASVCRARLHPVAEA